MSTLSTAWCPLNVTISLLRLVLRNAILNVFFSDVEILRIGSEIFQSSASLDFPGVMFLSDDAISRSGVLFAFSAYIIRNSTFSIQLWRPATTGTTSGDNALKAFQLIAEIPFNSTNMFARNDVSISSIIFYSS